jgi:hypothetical protein
MFTLFRETIGVLGRMRWLVIVFLVAFPLETAVQQVGRRAWRQAAPRARIAQQSTGVVSTFCKGASAAVRVFPNMGVGHVVWLNALFVLMYPRWAGRWLKVNAQLGTRTLIAWWAVLICAAATLLLPFGINWRPMNMSDSGVARVFWTMGLAVLSGWFAACAAAFWQTGLYRIILRAWAGQQTQWRDLNRQPADGWDSLKTFNFLVGFVIGIVVAMVNLGFAHLRRQGLPIRTVVDLTAVAPALLYLVVLLVPFGVVARHLRMSEAIRCSIRTITDSFFRLMSLLVPLAIGSAAIQLCETQLGSWLGAEGFVVVCLQPLRALLAVFGLVAGVRLFDQVVPFSTGNSGVRN